MPKPTPHRLRSTSDVHKGVEPRSFPLECVDEGRLMSLMRSEVVVGLAVGLTLVVLGFPACGDDKADELAVGTEVVLTAPDAFVVDLTQLTISRKSYKRYQVRQVEPERVRI